jgi:hypothetical protein
LQEWKITDSLPPRFEERVWQRIQREEKGQRAGAWAFLQRIVEDLRRPAFASSYIAFVLLLGIGAGYWQARTDNQRASHELGARYVEMIDPYQRR